MIGAGASGAAVAWMLARAGIGVVVPRAGRLGRPARLPALAAGLGAPPAHRLERRARTCAACPRTIRSTTRPRRSRRSMYNARGRQHDPLERAFPALPPVRLPRAQPRRRRRRLADRLRGAGAVLRPERPHDGRGRARRRSRPIRRSRRAADAAASRSTRSARPSRAASTGSAGTGGRRTAPSSRATTTAGAPASTAARATSAARTARRRAPTSPTGPRRSRLGARARHARPRARDHARRRTGAPTGVVYHDAEGRAARAEGARGRARRQRRSARRGSCCNSRSARFPDGLANRSGLVGRNLMFHPYAIVRGRLRRAARRPSRAHRLQHHQPGVLRDRPARGFVRGYSFQVARGLSPDRARPRRIASATACHGARAPRARTPSASTAPISIAVDRRGPARGAEPRRPRSRAHRRRRHPGAARHLHAQRQQPAHARSRHRPRRARRSRAAGARGARGNPLLRAGGLAPDGHGAHGHGPGDVGGRRARAAATTCRTSTSSTAASW